MSNMKTQRRKFLAVTHAYCCAINGQYWPTSYIMTSEQTVTLSARLFTIPYTQLTLLATCSDSRAEYHWSMAGMVATVWT